MCPSSLEEIIAGDRPKNRRERVLKGLTLMTPFAVTSLLLAAVWVVAGFAFLRSLVGYAILSFFVLGKFLILKGIARGSIGPWELALLVFYMDLAVAFLLTFNLDYVYGFPRLGARLEGLQENGQAILGGRPWLRKITFLGIVLFVMFPLTGTGAIGGSIFGRLLGLGRARTWFGIAVGSALGCFGIAALSDAIARLLPEGVRGSMWFETIGIVLVSLLVLFLWLRSRRIETRPGDRDGSPLGGS